MGTTNKPLVIWVAPAWKDHPKINELREKGHTIVDMNTVYDYTPDLILHPNAWRWHDGQWNNLEVALKEARRGQPKKAPTSEVSPKKKASRTRAMPKLLPKGVSQETT